MKKEALILCVIALVFSYLPIYGLVPAQAAGARLYLSPASGAYDNNSNFTVKVMVDSGGGTGINASEGALKYDSSHLTVSAVSDSGSIFELWTTKPTYNNTSGTINYGGGMPSAYTGNAGMIMTITFTAKQTGDSAVSFTSGVVLAADGKGTDIISGMSGGNYTINAPAEKPPEPPKKEETQPVNGVLPPAPEVNSSTHPDQNTWYADNNPEIQWKLLSDISGVSFTLDDKPDADPGNRSDGIIESKVFENTPDGGYYFHIKYQNKVGWGKITTRKVLIDSTPPSLTGVQIDNGGDPTNPTPILRFKSVDETSGIAEYKLYLDTAPADAKADEFSNGQYRFPPLLPGKHNIDLTIADKADNAASTSLDFIVDPLKAPIISDMEKVITTKDELIIQGTSFYPQVTIQISIAIKDKDPIVLETKSDDQGGWNYIYEDGLGKGAYEVWAKVIDDRGAQSLNSSKRILTVISPSLIELYGWLIILVLAVIIVLLGLFIFFLYESFKRERERITREVREAKLRLSEIFTALKEEVDELMELADKKAGLSESERRVKEKLQEALNISQEFLDKELEDVEKEIKMPKKEEK